MIAMIAVTILVFTIVVVVIWGLMLAANRWTNVWVAVTIGSVAIAYFAQSVIRGAIYCNQEPTIIGDAAYHNCDGPLGAVDYLYLHVVGPAVVAVLCVLTFRILQTSKRVLS